jgi:hypothetical protein
VKRLIIKPYLALARVDASEFLSGNAGRLRRYERPKGRSSRPKKAEKKY